MDSHCSQYLQTHAQGAWYSAYYIWSFERQDGRKVKLFPELSFLSPDHIKLKYKCTQTEVDTLDFCSDVLFWVWLSLQFFLPISPWKGSHRVSSSGVGLYLNLPLCEQSTRVFLSGIPKKEKKRNTLNGGGGGAGGGKSKQLIFP